MPTDHTDLPDDSEHAAQPGAARRSTRRRRILGLAAGTTLITGGLVVVGATSASAIVDGEPTTAAANPWQVALVSGGEQFCGGSLVSDRVIVTAAHCTEGTPAGQIQIRAGVEDLATNGGQTVQVASVIEHPSYAGGSADIAMLVLAEPVRFDDGVAAIPIATDAEAAAATTARVTGWGALGETDERVPDVMQSADVPTVGDAACDAALDGIDAANELCAGGTGTDSCYGDSGGPLTVDSDRGRVLAGVTSWGLECGGDTPGVYAEVPAFADWIAERVADPDAPAPERPEFDDEFGGFDDEFGDFDDELPPGVEIDEDGWIILPDAFFDQYGDDYLDQLDDDEFWALLEAWIADSSGDDDAEVLPSPGTPGSAADTGTGTDLGADGQFDHDTIDQLTDDEFGAWLDSLSDEEFDRYLDELDARWEADDLWFDDVTTDWDDTDWNDTDWNDTDWDDTDWSDSGWDDVDWDAEFDEMFATS